MINSTGQNRIVRFTKPNSPVFLDRTEQNTKELGLQALIDISPLSLSTKKVLGRSSRGFTHRRRLRLQHFMDLPEEGNQQEEGEMRMLQPCHHSQSQSR
jgi:hypothetical protein